MSQQQQFPSPPVSGLSPNQEKFLKEDPKLIYSIQSTLITPAAPKIRPGADSQALKLVTDSRRVWQDIHHSAKWGALPRSAGVARLALSDEDKQVRDFFVSEARSIGASISIDRMGNIFAVLPGENNNIPPIGMGSHLDTQPAGGRFDGILGVLGALEVLRTVRRSGKKTYAPLAAINWTNEEGARFWPGCSGSAVWATHTSIAQAHSLIDSKSKRMFASELSRIGYLGEVPANYIDNPLSAHFELHIEQQRLLQDSGKKLGVVTNIQGIRWYRVSVEGQRAHAGSTPMHNRVDALVLASKVILFLEEKAVKSKAVATVGVLDLDRPSSNTVPGVAHFTIDLRHASEEVLDELESSVKRYLDQLTKQNNNIKYDITLMWRSLAVGMHESCVSSTHSAAKLVVGKEHVMEMMSLAGHDSALTATRTPTSMIFVPSKDGISHAPEEFTSEEECGLGVQVLLEAVLNFDSKLRATKSGGIMAKV